MSKLFLLAQDHGNGQLVYVIAILILSALGALLEKLKNRREQQSTSRRKPAKPPPSTPGQTEPMPSPAGRTESPMHPRGPGHPPLAPPTTRRGSAPLPPPGPVQSPPLAPPPTLVGHESPSIPPHPVTPPPRPQKRPPRQPIARPKQPLAIPVASIATTLQPKVQTPDQTRIPLQVPPVREKLMLGAKRRLTSRELRRAVVLSEILQPPVGLR